MQALKEPLDAFLDLQIAAYDDAIQELPSQKENAPAGQVVVHRYFPKTKSKSIEISISKIYELILPTKNSLSSTFFDF